MAWSAPNTTTDITIHVPSEAAADLPATSHDSGAGTNLYLVVDVLYTDTMGGVIDSATYAGTNVPILGTQALTGSAWYLRTFGLKNPASGANDLVLHHAICGASQAIVVGIRTYAGVDQTTPVSGFTSATSVDAEAPFTGALTVSSATGDLVVAALGCSNAGTSTCDGTERYDVQHDRPLAGCDVAGAASVTITWTPSAVQVMAMTGFSLKAAASGGGVVPVGRQSSIMSGGMQALSGGMNT